MMAECVFAFLSTYHESTLTNLSVQSQEEKICISLLVSIETIDEEVTMIVVS